MTDKETAAEISEKPKTQVEGAWAVEPSEEISAKLAEKEEKPKSFVSRLIPKSKRGKVVFAAATAQVVSMVAVPVLWGITKKALPGALNDLGRHLTKVFDKEPKMMRGMLKSRTWDGLFEPEEQEAWKAAKGGDRAKLQAEKMIAMAVQGVYNIGSTLWVRNSLDKKLEINAGKAAVAKTQFLDTAIALGALLAIPTYMPEKSNKWRNALRPLYAKGAKIGSLGMVKDATAKEFGRDAAFFTVNIGLPDALGFTAGLFSMLGELDEKAAAHEKEQEAAAKDITPPRA